MVIKLYEQLEKLVKNQQNKYYYRCYSKENELIATIGRTENEIFLNNELQLFRNFSVKLLTQPLEIKSLVSIIETGQHYGLPTRFIDFTTNPYVALYFGIGRDRDRKNFNMCVLNRDNSRIEKELKKREIPLGELDGLTLGQMDMLTLAQIDEIQALSNLTESYILSDLFEMQFNKYFKSQSRYAFVDIKDNGKNKRKLYQNGLFVCMENPREQIPEELFEKVKIDLEENELRKLNKKLEEEGITKENLYSEEINGINIVKTSNEAKKEIKELHSII